MNPARAALGLLAVLFGLAGCVTDPVDVASTGEPALLEIHAAFDRAIARAADDPSLHWHSGHVGNAWVNFWGANNRGLCYHWQERIYVEVRPTVERVGWKVCGVSVNRYTDNEHHAVLVWDPDRVARAEIAAALPGADAEAPTYVLDAWRYGGADVWTLHDWLAIPSRVRTPPELEDVPPPGVELLLE